MPIVVNSNTTATTSSFNLASAISALRKSLASLRSGKRIDSPADDAGEQSLADNIHSWINRPGAVRQNIQNGLSYLQVQGGSLETIGSMLSRIAEFRTMASVATENLVELENYSKEFIELHQELQQTPRDNFNGVSLFCSDSRLEGITTLPPNTNQGIYEMFCIAPTIEAGGLFHYSYSFARHDSEHATDSVVPISLTSTHILKVTAQANHYDVIWDQDSGVSDTTNGSHNFSPILHNINCDTSSDNLLASTCIQVGGNVVPEDFPCSSMTVPTTQTTYFPEKPTNQCIENGAEQSKLFVASNFLTQNQVYFKSAHGRIMDVDSALESSKKPWSNILYHSSISLVTHANQSTSVALQILG